VLRSERGGAEAVAYRRDLVSIGPYVLDIVLFYTVLGSGKEKIVKRAGMVEWVKGQDGFSCTIIRSCWTV